MSPVKWVHPAYLINAQGMADAGFNATQIPVISLSALTEVVAFMLAVIESHYQSWKFAADQADESTEFKVLHADLMKHDMIYAEAYRLLAKIKEETEPPKPLTKKEVGEIIREELNRG